MTREEQKKALEVWYDIRFDNKKFEEARKISIKALEQEPCEDAISREDAIESAKGIYNSNSEAKALCIITMLKELPSVTPSRHKGHWIYDETLENWRCSKCNETPKTMGYVGTADFMAEHFKFCNHCGVEMESEE